MEQLKDPYDTPSDRQDHPAIYETSSYWDRIQDFTNKFWWVTILRSIISYFARVYEATAGIISIAMLASIVGILRRYNSTDINSWSGSWSLGSVVGLLATICEITMGYLLTAAISQWKWVWYKDSQKLTDLDIFDDSSRGALGSVKLLFSRPLKLMGAVGATITILTMLFQTMIQNAIDTKEQLVELSPPDAAILGGAHFPQGNRNSQALDYATGTTLGDQGPALDMVADINYGMFYTQMHRDTQVQLTLASCYTGNCTWNHIQSLGVCSKCADISSGIGVDNEYYTLYSTTLKMDREIGLVTSLGNTKYPDPSILPGIGPLIVHTITMVRGTVDEEPVGIDCALYWCVIDESQVIMTNYNITSEVITTWIDVSGSAKTRYRQETDIRLTPPTCYDQYGNAISDTRNCTKTITSKAQVALQNFFTGDKTGFTGAAVKDTTTNGWGISSEVTQLLFLTASASKEIRGSLELYLHNIGFMMASNIRQQTSEVGILYSSGNMYSWTTLFRIRWWFLVLPTLLVLTSVLFMLVIIFKSRGQEQWKSSLLPLLFHPLAERPELAPCNKMSEINVLAEVTQVRLQKGTRGYQFV